MTNINNPANLTYLSINVTFTTENCVTKQYLTRYDILVCIKSLQSYSRGEFLMTDEFYMVLNNLF